MPQIFGLICVAVLFLYNASGEITGTDKASDLMADQEFLINPDMEKELQKLEKMSRNANKLNKLSADIIPMEDPENIYDEMIRILNKIIEAVKNSNNAYKFLKANGLDRIVQQHLRIDNDKLKARTLILLKVLFDVAPTTTSAVIPITVIDRILDIFEVDNLGLKAHSIDIMYVWLPGNPQVQARVMKIKGFAPFYEQVHELDTSVIKTLLDLFNKILKEHIEVRNDMQKTIVDSDLLKFYQRIGLLEHMDTPVVCNGLMNIFLKTWSYSTDENNVLLTVFDILKNIKKFCLKNYLGKGEAKKLFIAIQKYIKKPSNVEYLKSNGLNVTEISQMIDEYVDKLKIPIKDEI